MSSAQLTAQLERAVARAVGDIGLVLEELRVTAAGRRQLVLVVVDGAELDVGLDLDTIATASRVVSAALDGCDDVLGGPYTLEVTSRGLDRPLTHPRHWRRARLRLVKVRLADDGGELLGRVGDADDDGVVLLVDGALRRLGYGEVDHAVVQVEFREPSADELRVLERPERSKEEPA